MTIIIFYCGQESLTRSGVVFIVNKRVWNALFGCKLKNNRMISLFSRQTFHYHSNPSLYPNPYCKRSWSWMVLWRCTRPSRTNIKKRCPLNHRGLDAKTGSQEIPGVTGNFVFGVHNEAEERLRVFLREHTGHRKQKMTVHMYITRWSILKLD